MYSRPSADDIAWAERIITAHAEAIEAGQGVVVVDGKLIETCTLPKPSG